MPPTIDRRNGPSPVSIAALAPARVDPPAPAENSKLRRNSGVAMIGLVPKMSLSSGVLWRTVSGQALPATPASLVDIMKREVLGEVSLSGAASSSGIVCVSEWHDNFEHHSEFVAVKIYRSSLFVERLVRARV